MIRGAKRLSDISALAETRGRLAELTLEECRAIDTLEAVRGLAALRYLGIGQCGELPSAAELQTLLALEVLSAWGSTCFVDGDLSVLTRLPALREVPNAQPKPLPPSRGSIPAAVF